MDIERIEIRLLQCLIALVEERNVTRAGERVGLSQPRMSNSLRRLRDLTGDPLLVRAAHGLIPTDRAIAMAAQIQAALEQISGALSEVRMFDPASSDRTFTVMMSGYTAAILLPDVFRVIRPIAPSIQIFNLPASHSDLHHFLDEGGCDLAFGYFRAPHPTLRVSNCFTDHAVCIANAERWKGRKMIPLEDFVAASHVSMGDSPTKTITIETILDHELQALGQRRCIVAHSPTHSAVAQIVASSDLLAILPARLAQDYVRHMPLRIFPPPFPLPTFHVTMMWHERSQKDPGHIWLREQFKKVGASLADVVSSR